jgi:hypothetical protein
VLALLPCRHTAFLGSVPDKLILYGKTRAPCANGTYAAVELLSESSGLYHAHPLQTGAMLLYSAGGVTFLRNLGRDSRIPELSAGQMILWKNLDGAARFPFRAVADNVLPGGPWQRAEFGTAHMCPVSQRPRDFWTRNVSGLNIFAHNVAHENVTVFIGYITLFNAATGDEQVIEDFSAVDYTWGDVIPDATLPQGRFAMALNFPPGVANSSRPSSVAHPMPGIFDARTWTHIRMFWRISENTVANISDVFGVGFGPFLNVESIPPGELMASSSTFDFLADGIGPGAPYPVPRNFDFDGATEVAGPGFSSSLSNAAARSENTTGDSFGAFSLSRYFSSGVQWNRSFFALDEGPLVLVDSLFAKPGDVAQSWLFGPNFNFDVAPNVTSFPGYFVARGFNFTGCFASQMGISDAVLTVKFAAFAADSPLPFTSGARRVSVVGNVFPFAIFAHADQPLGDSVKIFLSVLVPADSNVPSDGLAAAVSSSVTGGALEVSLPLPRLNHGAPSQSARIRIPAGAIGPEGLDMVTVERAPL